MLPRMLATTIIAYAIIFTVPTRTDAQDSSHSQVAPSQDPSELAPAPSTWKGAVADSLRLLLLEHTTRVAFQHKTRRELGGARVSRNAAAKTAASRALTSRHSALSLRQGRVVTRIAANATSRKDNIGWL